MLHVLRFLREILSAIHIAFVAQDFKCFWLLALANKALIAINK